MIGVCPNIVGVLEGVLVEVERGATSYCEGEWSIKTWQESSGLGHVW
jgi:hypothetical protein